MAMCLLAEVAYEHDEDLREHVPLLLQALLVVQDSPEPIVYQHAQQVGATDGSLRALDACNECL
jgi:hypothetical protein